MSSNKSPIFNWPEDKNGNPLSLVTTSVNEKIPTAPYASIDIFASVTRFVENPEEGINEGQNIVENGLKEKRKEILEELEKGD